MSETYKIIQDRGRLESFLDFLPDISKGQKFYCCLFARKKYFEELKSDKSQLKRFLATKENLIEKIEQLECKVGAFKYDKDGERVGIPQKALVLYINPNPRDMLRASKAAAKKLTDLVFDQKICNFNCHAEAMSCVQRAAAKKKFAIFDIDSEYFLPEHLNGILNKDSYRVLKTRGGYHILVEPNLVVDKYKKSFYLALSKFSDHVGDMMIPVPGCCQGGFSPFFV